jgi:hypothetical protein
MPLPKHREPSVFDRVNEKSWIITVPSQATGRPPTEAEAQARRRREGPCGEPGVMQPIWEGVRNGMPPLVPYTWRPGEQDREAEIQGRLAAIRARLAAKDGA